MFQQIVIGISCLIILQVVLTTIYSLGYHKRVYNHRPGPCRVIPGVDYGSEDIHLLKNGFALISSGLHVRDPLGFEVGASSSEGTIYLFDFNDPNANVTKLPILGDLNRADFRPHGISVWEEGEKQAILFVVNHAPTHEAIEVFQFDQEKRVLTYLYSITNPLMRSMNDVVAVGPDKIYFTNDGYYKPMIMRMVGRMLKFAWGNVVYYDHASDQFTLVVPKGLELNSIDLSPDRRYVYVSSTLTDSITIFERQQDKISLKPVQVIDLDTSVDNLMVDAATGDIWAGCHYIGYKSLQHLQDKSILAPSQVLRIRLGKANQPPFPYEVKEVYVDDGRQISGSSAAVFYNDKLLIGTVIQKLAYCEVLAF